MMSPNGAMYNVGQYGGPAQYVVVLLEVTFFADDVSSPLSPVALSDTIRVGEWVGVARRPSNQQTNSPAFGD
jgi:hypothetical protein